MSQFANSYEKCSDIEHNIVKVDGEHCQFKLELVLVKGPQTGV